MFGYVCEKCGWDVESEDVKSLEASVEIHNLVEHSRNDMFGDIEDFHLKFDLRPNSIEPHLLTPDLQKFRVRFLEEELDEFKEAWANKDLEGAFDGLIDLVYVALGTAFLMGLPFNQGWNLVHHANMKKTRALSKDQSKRGSTYDVVKPEGWKPPDLSILLKK